MMYGLFKGLNHIYTYQSKEAAINAAKHFGDGYYARELEDGEYLKRMKEIWIDGKYK